MARHPNKVLTHRVLLNAVWGGESVQQPELVAVIKETGATLAFDAISGGGCAHRTDPCRNGGRARHQESCLSQMSPSNWMRHNRPS
ncbi:MAG TPA: hypothetical protein VJW20_01785 [Candidatus Angelobacter sp.]|nr:hypothetical protein [Candidatus Angelobacter sp.]